MKPIVILLIIAIIVYLIRLFKSIGNRTKEFEDPYE